MSLDWQSATVPTGLQFNPSDSSFINLLYNFLIPLEASTLQQREAITLVATAKDPSVQNPTIGIGFDLKAGGDAVRNEVFRDLGFVVSDVDNGELPGNAESAIENGYLAQLRTDIAAGTPAAVSDMNLVMAQRLAKYNTDAAFRAYVYAGSQHGVVQQVSFAFLNDNDVR